MCSIVVEVPIRTPLLVVRSEELLYSSCKRALPYLYSIEIDHSITSSELVQEQWLHSDNYVYMISPLSFKHHNSVRLG